MQTRLCHNNLYFFSEDPPHLVATGTEVHSFFSSCVQEEEWEDLGNTYESWSHKLELKYMNEPTKMTGQSLLNFFAGNVRWAGASCQEAAGNPSNKYPVREELQCCWKIN